MAFPPGFLDELRGRADLTEIIGRHVKLIRRGREYVGLSPFQKEKSPSFTVVPEKGFYHCFSSGEHGDVIDFVMKVEGLAFPDAVRRVAAEAGLEVPADTPEERQREQRRQSLVDVMEAAAHHFERNLRLPVGKAALDYVKGRDVDDGLIAQFRLGFAADSRDGLRAALAREGIAEPLLVEAGLVIQPDDLERRPYDRFRGRLIFPITDRRGRVIAFGGRILGDGQPKYLNSPETPLFHKGANLYGVAQALKPSRDKGQVIVAEGYMDVIALHRAGHRNAVAPLGTALTEDQFRQLWRLAPEPVLCLDGDRAGQQAAARAAERALPLLKAGQGLRFAMLIPGEDPDSQSRRFAPEFLARALSGAYPLSEMLWRWETGGRTRLAAEERAALSRRLRQLTGTIGDADAREALWSAFRERLWQATRGRPAGRPGQGRPGRPGQWQPNPEEAPVHREARLSTVSSRVDRTDLHERILLATLIAHPALHDHVGERLGLLSFRSPDLDNFRQGVLKILDEGQDLDRAGLERHLRHAGPGYLLDELFGARTGQHAYFARPEAPLEAAREGWDETYRLHSRRDLLREIEAARARLAEDPSPAAFRYLQSLMRQQNEEVSEGDAQPGTPRGLEPVGEDG